MPDQPDDLTHHTLYPPTSSGTTDKPWSTSVQPGSFAEPPVGEAEEVARHVLDSLGRAVAECARLRRENADLGMKLGEVLNQLDKMQEDNDDLAELLEPNEHNVGWMGRIIEAHQKIGLARPWCTCGKWDDMSDDMEHFQHVARMVLEAQEREANSG